MSSSGRRLRYWALGLRDELGVTIQPQTASFPATPVLCQQTHEQRSYGDRDGGRSWAQRHGLALTRRSGPCPGPRRTSVQTRAEPWTPGPWTERPPARTASVWEGHWVTLWKGRVLEWPWLPRPLRAAVGPALHGLAGASAAITCPRALLLAKGSGLRRGRCGRMGCGVGSWPWTSLVSPQPPSPRKGRRSERPRDPPKGQLRASGETAGQRRALCHGAALGLFALLGPPGVDTAARRVSPPPTSVFRGGGDRWAEPGPLSRRLRVCRRARRERSASGRSPATRSQTPLSSACVGLLELSPSVEGAGETARRTGCAAHLALSPGRFLRRHPAALLHV